MKRKVLYLMIVALVCTTSLLAQNLSIEGVVVDKKTGETLIGASVMQKGTQNGTITNVDGVF